MNLRTKCFSIALSILFPLFACSSAQPQYEIGDCMNILGFKTVAYLHHALVRDNELAENCLHEEKRGKKGAHTVAMQGVPHERKQLKKDFVRYSQTLDEDFLREGIDQELDRIEEQAKKKKKEGPAERYSQLLSQCSPWLVAATHEALAEKRAIDAEHERQKKQASKTFEAQVQTTIMSIDQKPQLKSSLHNSPRSGLVKPVGRDRRTAKMVTYHLPPTPQVYAPVHQFE